MQIRQLVNGRSIVEQVEWTEGSSVKIVPIDYPRASSPKTKCQNISKLREVSPENSKMNQN
jgi:hypothetical protein